VAEEMRWTVGGGGALLVLTTKKNYQQMSAAEAEDDDSWQEGGHGSRGKGATAWRTMAAEETQRMVGSRGATTALTTT
jgi:hypothetical protein